MATKSLEYPATRTDDTIDSRAGVDFPDPYRWLEAEDDEVRAWQRAQGRRDRRNRECTERTNAGLSHYGPTVVEKLNDIGLIVDTSHCGRQTTLDACRFSRAPVTANHTSAEALYPHDRASPMRSSGR